jgi:hypothetical protein
MATVVLIVSLNGRKTWNKLSKRKNSTKSFHPRVFAVLRGAVIRERGGYVHHDLGLLVPAPSREPRGLGIVRDITRSAKRSVFRGQETLQWMKGERAIAKNETIPFLAHPFIGRRFCSEYLSFQMTRSGCSRYIVGTSTSRRSRKSSLHELDDAALLLLAHEEASDDFHVGYPTFTSHRNSFLRIFHESETIC